MYLLWQFIYSNHNLQNDFHLLIYEAVKDRKTNKKHCQHVCLEFFAHRYVTWGPIYKIYTNRPHTKFLYALTWAKIRFHTPQQDNTLWNNIKPKASRFCWTHRFFSANRVFASVNKLTGLHCEVVDAMCWIFIFENVSNAWAKCTNLQHTFIIVWGEMYDVLPPQVTMLLSSWLLLFLPYAGLWFHN